MKFKSNQFRALEVEYKEELADMYLLATFLSAKYEGENKPEAEKYFKKAVEYRKEYSIYLADLKEENSKDELLREAKLLYFDKKYSLAKKYFERILHFSFTDKELIEIYIYLLNIAKFDDDINAQINIYEKLLDLYILDDKLEKAKIYYELSFLFETKEEKVKSLNESSQYLTDGGESLEFKYKILKQLSILKKVKISDKERVLLLEKLVLFKPKYYQELHALKHKMRISFMLFIIILLAIALLYMIFK